MNEEILYRLSIVEDFHKIFLENPGLLKLYVMKRYVEYSQRNHIFYFKGYGLSNSQANIISRSIDLANYFERSCSFYFNPKDIANVIINELLRYVAKDEDFSYCEINPYELGLLVLAKDIGIISNNIMKDRISRIFCPHISTG